MEFLKKHYEKILLGLVLAGLVGALVFLPFYISADEQRMSDLIDGVINPRVTALPDTDLSGGNNALSRLQAPYILDFETANKLFNPMEWQRTLDGTMIPKVGHTGPEIVIVTNITPLYLVVTLDSVVTNDLGARYDIGVEQQAASNPTLRHKLPRFVSVNDRKTDLFTLLEVKGAPENPDALVLKLTDGGEQITISREKSFRHVEAYAADFRYDPERKVFHAERNGDKVSFNGADYTVDTVNQNELILQDQSNQKKTTLLFAP